MSSRHVLVLALAATVIASAAGCGLTPNKERWIQEAEKRQGVMNAQLNFDQAEHSFKTGQFDTALEQIERAITQNPESAVNHLLLGRIYIETNALENSIDALEEAQELDPELADAHYYAGIVFQRWSDDERAYDEYLTAFELDPDSVHYLLAAAESLVALERYEEAKDLVHSKLTYFEHNSALRHLLGQVAIIEGRSADAADYLEEAWLFNPEDDLLLEDLAYAQYTAGRYAKCLNSIRDLRERGGGRRPELIHFEALCLTRMERLKEAHTLYRNLTGLVPSDTDVWVDFGTLAWELGDYHRLALCGARLAALAPERYEGYLFKGVNESHHGNLEEAIALLRDAAERSEGAPIPYVMLGRVLQDAGDYDGAREAYETCLQLDPSNEPARLLLDQINQEEELATVPPSGQVP
jgi:tetratricopeptide (TPR) repeat protein